MKFSLISATSIIALLSAGVGPVQAATLTATPIGSNLYDLVHDGVTSSDGGDATVTPRDPLVTAALALEASTNGLQSLHATGPIDPALAAGGAYPSVPLGAAAATKAVDDPVTSVATTGNSQWDAFLKARAIGQERIASLIGTIGNGPAAGDKSNGTVFVAAASPAGFNDGGDPDAGGRTSAVASAFAPSSTSTATITVAGAGNLSRPSGALSVIAANSLQRTAPTVTDGAPAVVMADASQSTLGYTFAPVVNPAAASNAVSASFSDVITARGVRVADWRSPAIVQTSENMLGTGKARMADSRLGQPEVGKTQTSELKPAQSGVRTSEAAPNVSKLLDLSQPGVAQTSDIQIDGTRRFLSASVSANPTTATALYMANVVNATPISPVDTGATIEAFQIGPQPGPKAQSVAAATVAEPLRGKILASAGPLNSNLALP